ncbi:unnamed protein product [Amoebophrya sp. A120]|nr:unnamed protein product [Amoebophrya sp. A120]|eukprot:GSA120T00018588001.1
MMEGDTRRPQVETASVSTTYSVDTESTSALVYISNGELVPGYAATALLKEESWRSRLSATTSGSTSGSRAKGVVSASPTDEVEDGAEEHADVEQGLLYAPPQATGDNHLHRGRRGRTNAQKVFDAVNGDGAAEQRVSALENLDHSLQSAVLVSSMYALAGLKCTAGGTNVQLYAEALWMWGITFASYSLQFLLVIAVQMEITGKFAVAWKQSLQELIPALGTTTSETVKTAFSSFLSLGSAEHLAQQPGAGFHWSADRRFLPAGANNNPRLDQQPASSNIEDRANMWTTHHAAANITEHLTYLRENQPDKFNEVCDWSISSDIWLILSLALIHVFAVWAETGKRLHITGWCFLGSHRIPSGRAADSIALEASVEFEDEDAKQVEGGRRLSHKITSVDKDLMFVLVGCPRWFKLIFNLFVVLPQVVVAASTLAIGLEYYITATIDNILGNAALFLIVLQVDDYVYEAVTTPERQKETTDARILISRHMKADKLNPRTMWVRSLFAVLIPLLLWYLIVHIVPARVGRTPEQIEEMMDYCKTDLRTRIFNNTWDWTDLLNILEEY